MAGLARARVPRRAIGLAGLLLGLALLSPAPDLAHDGVIDRRAVRHDANGPDQIVWATAENPAVRFLFLRFACRAGDGIRSAGVRFYRIGERDFEGFRDYDMEVGAVVDSLEYRTLTLPLEDDPKAPPNYSRWRGYRLWLDDESQLFWLGSDSLSTREDRVERFDRLFRPTSPGATLPGTIDPADAGISDRVLLLPGWVPDAIIYWIDVDRFRNGDPANDPPRTLPWGGPPGPGGRYGGDLAGVIQALPMLDSLGVNTILLSPLTPFAGDDPLAPTDLKSIEPGFGDEATLKALIKAAHLRGMRVMVQGVFNQASSLHPWFKDAVEWQLESDFWSFFRISGAPVVMQPEPNYAVCAGHPELPLWNTENVDCRDELLGAMRWWMSFRIDGWLLEGPETQPARFWEGMRETARALHPPCYVVANLGGDPRPWLQTGRFDSVVESGIREALLGFAADSTRDAGWFDRALGQHGITLTEPLGRISFNTLDTPGTPRLLDATGSLSAARMAVFLQMSLGGAPVIEYGDELGMRGADPVSSRACWSPGPGRSAMREWYHDMIRIRRDHPALRRGSATPLLVEGEHYALLRRSSEEILLVVVNRSNASFSAKVPLPRGVVGGTRQKDAFDLITGARHAIRSGEIHLKEIPPMTGQILQLR